MDSGPEIRVESSKMKTLIRMQWMNSSKAIKSSCQISRPWSKIKKPTKIVSRLIIRILKLDSLICLKRMIKINSQPNKAYKETILSKYRNFTANSSMLNTLMNQVGTMPMRKQTTYMSSAPIWIKINIFKLSNSKLQLQPTKFSCRLRCQSRLMEQLNCTVLSQINRFIKWSQAS